MGYVRVGGVDLYSEVHGDGDPVLLLHGGFCSLEHLRAQSEALAVDRRVFAFERPGHGRSPDVDEDFSYERGVVDALGFLDAWGLRSVDVVGYSDGAIIGLLLALWHPERVRSLVAISANLDPTAFRERTAGDRGALPALPSPAPGSSSGDPERAHYDRLSPDGPAHGDVVLAKLFRLWREEPRIDAGDLARVRVPTLVMSGDRDTIRPDHSLLIASSIPAAQLAVVPGTTHALISERPELVRTLVHDFLADRRGQDPDRRSSQTK